ncbi:MAG TPA: TetR/AcrR family transcriptional regulator [Tenuifilum sp.]|uniref:TetR/AcrR family transcriptional regulator n=1 Tax=Tenuifilum sp. TaxID=2760880 RepID=UPI002C20ACA4|nr:TetR/AcrR family transcriptional regulator [Tenuifilum sp.]
MRNKLLKEKRMRGYFIEAAKEILKGEGIDSMSVRNIADQAGYSYATLYNYFKDVTDVINECINDFAEECQEYVDEKTRNLPDGPEKLKAIIKSYVGYFLEYPSIFDVFFLEKINKIEKKRDTSQLIVTLLERLCKPQWNYLINNEYISSSSAEKAITILRYQIPGMLLFYLNRSNPDSPKEFYSLFDTQLDKLIRFEIPTRTTQTFEEVVLKFIFDGTYPGENYYFFIHYTREKQVVDSILKTGFKYIESFHNSAEQIIDDKLDFLYKHNIYKPYGNFIVVIGISRNIFDKYAQLIRSKGINTYIENILCDTAPEFDDEAEEYRYTLPTQYIKGYVNYVTGETVKNPSFNPDYDSTNFLNNLNSL